MCDMQKLPTQEDASCEEETDMNFATFSAVGSAGTHFVTTGGQIPVSKIQQNVANNGNLQQVCLAMGEGGVQYVRTLEGGATLQAAPQLISVPIALPGAKPGDPQPTVQIQVLNPNHLIQTQQQPKYQMQIQGFQQGGAVLTVAYSPETSEATGIQLVGQSGMGEGLQVLTLPQEMQLVQQTQTQEKEQMPSNMHQVFITPNQQIIINTPDGKTLNNNTTSDNNNTGQADIIIKEECDENTNDDESSQGTEGGETIQWQIGSNQQDLLKYLNSLPPQQTQQLPESLQQFLRMNPTDLKKEVSVVSMDEDRASDEKKEDDQTPDAVLWGDAKIQSKKKKKYKKKPPKPVRPKPGQVVIATSIDGTAIYCCPECQMAYPEKEMLEAHLSVHNIERRFICGICGAALKRKEHLERHKLGHNPERPYVCGVCRKGFKRREHLNLHTVIHSGVKTEMCNECGKGFYRKDHLRKHTRSHESKRAREETNNDGSSSTQVHNVTSAVAAPAQGNNNMLPEITIHIPTSDSNQAPVQINIPSHVVTSLAAHGDTHTLDALLAHHT